MYFQIMPIISCPETVLTMILSALLNASTLKVAPLKPSSSSQASGFRSSLPEFASISEAVAKGSFHSELAVVGI